LNIMDVFYGIIKFVNQVINVKMMFILNIMN